jgi:hypothetical protein
MRHALRGWTRRHRQHTRWVGLLVPLAIAVAIATGGIALATTLSPPPVWVTSLSVSSANVAIGQTQTARTTLVARKYTVLAEVAIAVRAPDGSRVDFPHALNFPVLTSPTVFSRHRSFSVAGTYVYWVIYKKDGRWVNLNPRLSFTVGGVPTPSPSPTAPATSPPPSPKPSPSSSARPSPSSPPPTSPTPLLGCASNPGRCGYPTTTTTGVPAGTALAVVTGDVTVTTSGAVIQGEEIHGCVTVRAANVIIRNSRIIGPCFYGVDTDPATGTTTIDRVEINCVNGQGTGVNGPRFAAHAVYIHDCENGLEIDANSSVTDSVISAREGTSSAHADGIQSQGGNNVVIRHNTLLEVNPVTSAIITNPTLNNGWLVEQNFMGGGAYTFYCPEQGTGFVVRNNRFVPARTSALYSGAYGLTDACNHTGITWTGNYLDTDGSTVGPSA